MCKNQELFQKNPKQLSFMQEFILLPTRTGFFIEKCCYRMPVVPGCTKDGVRKFCSKYHYGVKFLFISHELSICIVRPNGFNFHLDVTMRPTQQLMPFPDNL